MSQPVAGATLAVAALTFAALLFFTRRIERRWQAFEREGLAPSEAASRTSP
jgi:hypothetical protein